MAASEARNRLHEQAFIDRETYKLGDGDDR